MCLPIIHSLSCKKLVKNVNLIRLYTFSALAYSNPSPIEEERTLINTHHQNPLEQNPTLNTHIRNSFFNHYSQFDTVKVVQTLNNFKNEPGLALSYFNQLKGSGFCHDSYTYAAIVRILCYWGRVRELDCILLEIIRKDRDLNFEIVKSLFEALAKELEGECSNVLVQVSDALVKVYAIAEMFDKAIDFLFQINCSGFIPFPCILSINFLMNKLILCGKVDLAVDTYRELKYLRLSPNKYTYTIAIKAFCRKGRFDEVEKVFQEMEEVGLPPNAFAYTTYIEGLCTNGRTDSGCKLLQFLITHKIPVDVFAFTVVIRGFCNELKVEEAESILHDMKRRGFAPDVYIYGALISGYCRVGNSHKALELHDEMVSKGIKTNCVIVSLILKCFSQKGRISEVVYRFNKFKEMGIFFDVTCYNVVMDAFCKMGEVEAAMVLFVEMKGKHMVPDIINYTTLINGYVLKGNLTGALGLFKEMRERGHKPDLATYNALASGFARNGLAQVHNLLCYMESQGVKPNTGTHNLIIEGLCIGGKVDEAEAFFGSLEEKCLENYSAMVSGFCEANRLNEAIDLFIMLADQGFIVKKASCIKLLKSLCLEGRSEKAVSLLQTMMDLNVNHAKINSKVVGSLCQEGEMKKAQWYLDMMVVQGLIPDLITYTIMINGYCKVNCLREAYYLFYDMKNRGIEPDVITYTILLDNWSKISLRNSRSRSYNVEAQENMINPSALWGEMKDMGIKPDVTCYTVLIDRHCKTNNVQEAVNFFHEMIDRGIEPDTVTYTALLSGHCNTRDIEKAEVLIDEMSDKRIQPDSWTESVKHCILKARKVLFRKSATG